MIGRTSAPPGSTSIQQVHLRIEILKGPVRPFSVSKIGIEESKQERRLTPYPGKQKNRNFRLHTFHFSANRAASRIRQVVLQEHAMDWLFHENREPLTSCGC